MERAVEGPLKGEVKAFEAADSSTWVRGPCGWERTPTARPSWGTPDHRRGPGRELLDIVGQAGDPCAVSQLFRLPSAVPKDPAVAAWFDAPQGELRRMAQPWFERMRACGPDVRELVHDDYPTACAGDAAFAYVGAFSAHANVGFFHGAALDDPAGLLEGSGKRMRHVKLRWGRPVDEAALDALVAAAYRDIRSRLAAD